MLFNYAKIDSLSGEHIRDSFEQSQTHAERGRSTMWTKICDKLQVLRWPTTFFLLFIIVVCEISILRKQTTSLPIGAEVNGLVPHCMLLTCRSHGICLMARYLNMLTYEKSRKSKRYSAQTLDTFLTIRLWSQSTRPKRIGWTSCPVSRRLMSNMFRKCFMTDA
jgi:hypothetical protein